MSIKIVIIGPESTGKSTLCKDLAAHFNTKWCPEYAREFLTKNPGAYSYEDLLTIAKGQIELEASFSKDMKDDEILFVDTDMYVMKVWCEYVFGKCHRFILDQVVERKYDFYLLCNTDLPWAPDPLREYPDPAIREHLFSMYKDILINQSVPWAEVGGQFRERLETAIRAAEQFLNNK